MNDQVVETMARVRPDGYAAAARVLSAADILADIARLPVGLPVQIIVGASDTVTPPESQPRDRRALSGRAFPLDPRRRPRALSGKTAGVQPTGPRPGDAAHWVDRRPRSNRLTRHVFKVVR